MEKRIDGVPCVEPRMTGRGWLSPVQYSCQLQTAVGCETESRNRRTAKGRTGKETALAILTPGFGQPSFA